MPRKHQIIYKHSKKTVFKGYNGINNRPDTKLGMIFRVSSIF